MKGAPDRGARRTRLRRALVLVAIVLLAANLRPAITSVALLIGRMSAGTRPLCSSTTIRAVRCRFTTRR